jgi:hypothetical protein
MRFLLEILTNQGRFLARDRLRGFYHFFGIRDLKS